MKQIAVENGAPASGEFNRKSISCPWRRTHQFTGYEPLGIEASCVVRQHSSAMTARQCADTPVVDVRRVNRKPHYDLLVWREPRLGGVLMPRNPGTVTRPFADERRA